MYIVQYSQYTRLDIIELWKVSMMLPCKPVGCRVTRRELRGRMVAWASIFFCLQILLFGIAQITMGGDPAGHTLAGTEYFWYKYKFLMTYNNMNLV